MTAKTVTKPEPTQAANASAPELLDVQLEGSSIKFALSVQAAKTPATPDAEQAVLLVRELAALSQCLKTRELSLLLELLSLLARTSQLEESESAYYSGHIQGTISHLREMLKYDA